MVDSIHDVHAQTDKPDNVSLIAAAGKEEKCANKIIVFSWIICTGLILKGDIRGGGTLQNKLCL